MKSSIPRIIGCDMIENQIYYVNKIFDLKWEQSLMPLESDVLSARDWQYLDQRLTFSTKEIDIIVFAFI